MMKPAQKRQSQRNRHLKRKDTPAVVVAMNQIRPGSSWAYLTSHCVSWAMYRVWLCKGTPLKDALRYTSYTYQGIVPEGYRDFFNEDDPALKRWILGRHFIIWPSSWRNKPQQTRKGR